MIEHTLETRGLLAMAQDYVAAAIEAWRVEEHQLYYESLQLAVNVIEELARTRDAREK
jgi:hypothetical protein